MLTILILVFISVYVYLYKVYRFSKLLIIYKLKYYGTINFKEHYRQIFVLKKIR